MQKINKKEQNLKINKAEFNVIVKNKRMQSVNHNLEVSKLRKYTNLYINELFKRKIGIMHQRNLNTYWKSENAFPTLTKELRNS